MAQIGANGSRLPSGRGGLRDPAWSGVMEGDLWRPVHELYILVIAVRQRGPAVLRDRWTIMSSQTRPVFGLKRIRVG